MRLAWASPSLGADERAAVLECLASGRVSMGARVRAFEDAMCRTVGVAHAVALSSGTAALDVALQALDVGPGDEVIVPAFTYVATVNAVVRRGALPVMVDVDPRTLNRRRRRVRDARRGRRRRGGTLSAFASWTRLPSQWAGMCRSRSRGRPAG